MPIPEITADENDILARKYESAQFGKLSDPELLKAARLLLLKIHVIAGWAMPERELIDILTDQFTKKIKESYSNVNADEIEYAFRQNTSVKDWGKNLNILLIDEVMSEYLDRRLDISRLEEKYRTRPAPLPPPKEDDPMTDDEFIEMNYRIWQTLGNPGMISVKCYPILVAQKKINLTQEQKDEMFTTQENLLKLKMANDRTWHEQLEPVYNNPEHWKSKVFNECKKKAVETYFKKLQSDNEAQTTNDK